MPYNPSLHHRRSIRLKGYDYSQDGLYFVTICCQDRICRFGEIKNNEMILNEYGKIAFEEWMKLIEQFSNFELDVFQIMPNHIHGIIVLNVGATLAVAPIANDAVAATITNDAVAPIAENPDIKYDNNAGDDTRATARVARTTGSVSDIVGAYKSLVANGCLKIYKSKNEIMGKLWQRNYYEHIIRNEKSFQRIAEYIINNPKMWNKDKFHRK